MKDLHLDFNITNSALPGWLVLETNSLTLMIPCVHALIRLFSIFSCCPHNVIWTSLCDCRIWLDGRGPLCKDMLLSATVLWRKTPCLWRTTAQTTRKKTKERLKETTDNSWSDIADILSGFWKWPDGGCVYLSSDIFKGSLPLPQVTSHVTNGCRRNGISFLTYAYQEN